MKYLYEYRDELKRVYDDPAANGGDYLEAQWKVTTRLDQLFLELESDAVSDFNDVVNILLRNFGIN